MSEPPGSSPSRTELEADLGSAALRYFEVTGTRLFVIPIANTTPQMFIAAGEIEAMIELLTRGPPTALPG
jgi:hypothetical protein